MQSTKLTVEKEVLVQIYAYFSIPPTSWQMQAINKSLSSLGAFHDVTILLDYRAAHVRAHKVCNNAQAMSLQHWAVRPSMSPTGTARCECKPGTRLVKGLKDAELTGVCTVASADMAASAVPQRRWYASCPVLTVMICI